MNTLRYKLLVFLSLLALAGCAPATALANPSTATPLPQSTPTSLPTPVDTPTGIAGGGPDGGTGNNANVITLDNNNQLITLHVGETFLLKLGEGYDWSPVPDDPSVLSRVMNIAVVKGAQGIYSAHKAGAITLTATGDPVCRQSKPACMLPSILFTLHIEVMP